MVSTAVAVMLNPHAMLAHLQCPREGQPNTYFRYDKNVETAAGYKTSPSRKCTIEECPMKQRQSPRIEKDKIRSTECSFCHALERDALLDEALNLY